MSLARRNRVAPVAGNSMWRFEFDGRECTLFEFVCSMRRLRAARSNSSTARKSASASGSNSTLSRRSKVLSAGSPEPRAEFNSNGRFTMRCSSGWRRPRKAILDGRLNARPLRPAYRLLALSVLFERLDVAIRTFRGSCRRAPAFGEADLEARRRRGWRIRDHPRPLALRNAARDFDANARRGKVRSRASPSRCSRGRGHLD